MWMFCCSTLGLAAQPDLSQIVTIQYDGVPLEYALEDLEREYDLRFTYSKDFIPLRQKVSVFVVNEPLSVALDELFAYTQVVYMSIGNQIALKIDENKDLTFLFELEEKRRQQQDQDVMLSRYPVIPEQEAELILTEMPVGDADTTQVAEVAIDTSSTIMEETAPIVFEPPSGTNSTSEQQTLSDVLFSDDYDFSNGVEGVVNVKDEDLEGVQLAIFANANRGDFKGLQAATFANVNLGYVEGAQVAGLFNRSGQATALQASLVGNIAGGDFEGIQISSVFNATNGHTNGIQLTSGVNYSRLDAKVQLGATVNIAGRRIGVQLGGVNIASTVDGGQVGGLNIAREVKGLQIGLVNVADTVSGVPIALINIIRKGYNRVELSYQPSGLNANIALKLGTHSFYNILFIGAAFENPFTRPPSANRIDAWGLGYGIGTTLPFGRSRWQSNIEITAAHVNEGEAWLDEFNLLSQAKLTLDFRFGRRASFFAGPQINMMFSDLLNAETMTYGSDIAHAPFHQNTNEITGRTTQLWWGWSAGIRF